MHLPTKTNSTPLHGLLIFFLVLLFGIGMSVPDSSAQQAEQPDTINGTIAETMNTGGYTYIKLSKDEQFIWIAIPETPVKIGDEVSCLPGMVMKNFHSNTLNRTFESIIFSPGIAGQESASGKVQPPQADEPADNSFAAAVQAENTSSMGTQEAQSQVSGGSMGAVAPFAEIAVEKADGDNSFTVGELYAKAKELNGKKVRVRGKVVKYNASIMGRNWVHLQDGSGDPMQNTHDLVVTTTTEIGSPSVLTVEGTLAADKDFGAGYRYAVIVEDCAIIK